MIRSDTIESKYYAIIDELISEMNGSLPLHTCRLNSWVKKIIDSEDDTFGK